MDSALPQENSEENARPLSPHVRKCLVTKDDLNEVLPALAIPFDLAVARQQWRSREP